jgi:hypothetical protein
MQQRIAIAISLIIFPAAVIAEPCTVTTKRMKVEEGARVAVRNEECPNSDRRVIKVLLERDSEPPRILVRRTQKLSEAPTGRGAFIDLEDDGVPEVELTGYCSAPNCEYEIFKFSEDRKSMFHYYSGGYESVTRTPTYLVTSSYGNYVSWEYLAYDPFPPKYPIENSKFRYSIYISSAEGSGGLTCRITEPSSRGKLQLVVPPPEELLKFCRHYGDDVQILNLGKGQSSRSRKHAPSQETPPE